MVRLLAVRNTSLLPDRQVVFLSSFEAKDGHWELEERERKRDTTGC